MVLHYFYIGCYSMCYHYFDSILNLHVIRAVLLFLVSSLLFQNTYHILASFIFLHYKMYEDLKLFYQIFMSITDLLLLCSHAGLICWSNNIKNQTNLTLLFMEAYMIFRFVNIVYNICSIGYLLFIQ